MCLTFEDYFDLLDIANVVVQGNEINKNSSINPFLYPYQLEVFNAYIYN